MTTLAPRELAAAETRRRARERLVALQAAADAPVARQALLVDHAALRRRRHAPARFVIVLLASLMAHGVLVSVRMIRGVDVDRVASLTRGGPMRVRAMRREAKQRARALEREREERPREERERAERKARPRPEPEEELPMEVDEGDEPAGEEVGEGGEAGPVFGGTPVLDGAGGGSGAGGPSYTLGSGDGSGRARRGAADTRRATEAAGELPRSRRSSRRIDPDTPVPVTREMKPPRPLPGNTMPVYPEPVRRRGISGTIVVRIHVHKDGSVRGIKIVQAENSATRSDHAEKADAALKKSVVDAVRRWRYTPAEYRGQKISVWVRAKFPFKLEK